MKRSVISFLAGVAISTVSPPAGAGGFELTSPDIQAAKTIGRKFVYNGLGCTGDNVSPELVWRDPPAATKSFAVLVHDPDAPKSGGFWHWIVANIPASARGLAQGAGTPDGKKLPEGSVQLQTDFGDAFWGGPCPPPGAGAHYYAFTVYALGLEKLKLAPNAKASVAAAAVAKNAIGKASLTALYGR
ncbi:MAG: YbhB/YbcL family Raf kinase inhibitor-like protein [Methylocystis sp.]|nr:YbhB/YbcL family Raf kinase inhibitor-like protein [Methylocystis sp.]MBI3274460.1 YbhB/YbcL family Raf kinase inhibitor-like protein [Methylocystis sp.]